jgi:GT2 family glycosyltransferase
MNKPFVEIIVVGYALPDLEEKCISSIIRNTTDWPYILTFIDNYDTGWSLTEVWETLVERCKEEYIVLLNNDTEVYPKWLSRMMEVMLSDPDIGFCGPSTSNCHSPQKNISTYEEAEKHIGKVEYVTDPLSGFCFLMKREAWREAGGFDCRYRLYGSESDLADRAHKLDYKSCWVKSSYVFHHGECSVKASGMDVKAERERAKKLYWSERGK